MVKAVALLVLWLTATATLCRSSSGAENGVDNIKDTTSDAARSLKTKIEGAMNEAKYKSGALADWAMAKVSQKIRVNNAKDNAMEKAYVAYAYLYDVVLQALKKVSNMAEEKGNDAYDLVSEGAGRATTIGSDTADDVNEKVENKAREASNMASDMAASGKDGMQTKAMEKASDAEEKLKAAVSHGRDEAYDGYNEARSKVDKAYGVAEDTMSERAKERYEKAKEKASDAAGNIGEHMRTVG